MRALRGAILLLCAFAGCARPLQEFRPIVAPTADSAWTELLRVRRDFAGAKSFARVRVVQGDRRQSFQARLTVDAAGRVRIDGLTPIGTAAITLWTDGRDAVYLDHLNQVYWTGAASELRGPLRALSAGAAMLLIGLPATNAREGSTVTHRVAPAGLSEAVLHVQPELRFTYLPAQFPPSQVSVSAGGNDRIEIEHIEITSGADDLQKPRVYPGYTAGSAPTLTPAPGG